ncbi:MULTISPECIES: stage II sporulation protein P [Clostridium]|uniref:Stage II sporulation protein P n=1 Tax=Clostridium tertium TaxID=1559 RepID=A0A9X3XJC7_9CLOT|nr:MULTISPECIES: stage II sporulation protein P [Clostridium]MBU6135284.1 stage II sporulation protein P [Clostridium tertium]MDB1949427.1 stage II sporulation protein P [Clostridium tertium]MDC4239983.1 stage II sporulation protein P [Clostridium tertium]MDU2680534.1 stage II sporulation protein P [Clostridium sp.]MDU7363572.1 stage II sporulation protein P [Clostridium sp.]
MKKIHKNIIVSLIFLTICVTLGYLYLRKQNTLSDSNKIDNSETTKSTDTINDSSNISLLDTIKDITIDNSNSTIPLSSDIVIYNSHPDEEYEFGVKVTDLGALINHKLNTEGLNSSFISSRSNIEYLNSYKISNESITQNASGYENAILLDIHRSNSGSFESNPEMITFVLAKDNQHFEENNKFAEQLINEILKSDKVKASIYYYDVTSEYLKLNQELSNNSLQVEIGTDKSDDNYIQECVDVLVSSLKNIKST